MKIGVKQYLILAVGYDAFAYRQPDWAKDIQIFELGHPFTGVDKQKRIQSIMTEFSSNLHYISIDFTEDIWERNLIKCSQFDQSKISFYSLLGVSYFNYYE